MSNIADSYTALMLQSYWQKQILISLLLGTHTHTHCHPSQYHIIMKWPSLQLQVAHSANQRQLSSQGQLGAFPAPPHHFLQADPPSY